MHQIYNRIFSKKALFVLLSIFAVTYFASFINRYIQTDENWFGEEAYYLLKEGTVRLKSMPLTLDFDQRVYVYYKLFVFAGSALIWLFGWSIWPLKFFVFSLYLLFLVIFRRWLKNAFIGFNAHQQLLTLFFLITTPFMIDQTFIYRPEIPMMLLCFLSFMFIHKGIKNDSIPSISLGAVFAGISFLMHLNGNVFMLAGLFFILSYKKYKSAIIFSIISGFISLLYFFDIADYQSFQAFMFQLKNWPIVDFKEMDKNSFGYIGEKLLVLLSEHQRFFWSIRVYSVSLLFFVCLIFGFKELKKRYPEILRYFLILVLCLNIFGGFIAERYLVYYLPFMAFVIGFTIHYYLQSAPKSFTILIIALMGLHVTSIALRFNFDFKTNYNHREMHQAVLNQIPQKSKVLAPWEFIYNGIEDYQITSYKNIEYYKFRKVSTEELLEITNKLNVDYIIISPEFYSRVEVDAKAKTVAGFNSFFTNEKYTVLKRATYPENVALTEKAD